MYPEIVESKLEEIFPYFEDFAKDAQVDTKVLKELLLESMTKKFIEGQDLTVWEEHEMTTILGESIFLTTLNSLKSKGLVDVVQDENGEDIMFLTRGGKDIAELLFGPNSEDEKGQ